MSEQQTPRRRPRRRVFELAALRRRTERGAALVEAAIVVIPLSVILFGIIEYGFIFKDSLTLSSATRAGARTASAEPTQATFFTDTVASVTRASSAAKFKVGDYLWIYKYAASASSDPSAAECVGGSSTCMMYTWNGSAFTLSSGSWSATNVNACLGGAALDSVGVKLKLSHDAITGFFRNLTLTEKTVMQLEPISNC